MSIWKIVAIKHLRAAAANERRWGWDTQPRRAR